MTSPLTETQAVNSGAETPTPKTATICQLLHSLNVGGAEVLAERLGRRLQDKYRFVFACLDELGPLGEQLQQAGYAVRVLGRKPGWDLACARALRDWVRDEQVDLIHAHQYTPFSYALLSGMFRSRPPVLFTEHGRWFPDIPRKKRILFNRTFLRRTDRVIAVGEFVRQALIQNEGLPPERVRVIRNGVDVEQYQPASDPAQRLAVREELGLSEEAFVLMQVARLDALKDHLTAVRTLSEIVKSRAQTHLVLIGEGPERSRIEEEANRLGVAGRLHLLGTRRDVPRLLWGADVFLLSSISEGLPLTVIEAMLTGVPVVATNVGGLSEVVIPEETGLLAPAKDAHGLAEAALRFREESTWRAKIVAQAAGRARRLFSEEANHAAYCQLYEQMLGG